MALVSSPIPLLVRTVTLTVKNRKAPTSRSTGLSGVTFTWIAGSAVLCIGVAHLIRSRKQAEESEQEKRSLAHHFGRWDVMAMRLADTFLVHLRFLALGRRTRGADGRRQLRRKRK